MKKKLLKTSISLAVTAATCVSLIGCGSTSFVSTDVTSYPLVNALTQQEVVDYYAKSLEYDSIISRNVTVHETTYETKDIDGAKAEKLKGLLSEAENILSKNEYEYSVKNASLVSEDVYNYIKATIDNEYLTNSKILNIKGALGYYFVDVEYDINPRTLGTFNQMTPLIGLDGAFQTLPLQGYTVDVSYMLTMTKKLNQYYADNRIMKAASFDVNNGSFAVIDGADPNLALRSNSTSSNTIENNYIPNVNDIEPENNTEVDSDIIKDENGNVVDENGNIIYTAEEYQQQLGEEATESEALKELEEQQSSVVQNGGMSYESIVSDDRMITLDSDLINSIVGISLKQKAFLPELNLVYNKPDEQGVISGNGIYAAGGNGLKVFGFDRNKLAGKIKLRYVFKDATDGTADILGVNIYVVEEEITTGFNVSNQNLVIPDFLNEQFEILVDRSDRVMINCDITGLMSGNLYQDMGVAVLRGYRELHTNTLKYLSTIRQVIARDYNTNSYLLEIETTTQEGAKSADVYGTYRDKYYIVIQQQGTDFILVDSIRMSREMCKEPAINPDDATTKRLVALNLAGDVNDDTKEAVSELLSDWYTASTNRMLHAKDSEGNYKTFVVDGKEMQLKKGMYDCFQTDINMLSSENLEYMQSQVRNQLDKYGSTVNVIYSGTVTEWIGGADNQVEFTTEELVSYSGREDAHYMQVYYLVSNMNDMWVIDERTVLDERDVSGNDLLNIKERVGQ